MSDAPLRRRWPQPGALPWLGSCLGLAALLVFDPLISGLVPVDIWASLGLRDQPYRAALVWPALAICLWGAWRLLRLAPDFTALALVLIFVASQLNGIAAGPLDSFDAALFGVFAIWLARDGLDPNRRIRLSPLFWLASALMILAMAYLPLLTPLPWVIGVFGIVRIVILTFLLVDLCRDARSLELGLRILLWTAVVSAIFGMIQFTLAYFQIFFFTLIDPPITAFKPTPLGFVMRASSLCSTAQHYSSYLIYALPFALWRASETWSWRDLGVCAILIGGIGVSLNFGGLFAALVVMMVFPFLRWRNLAIHILLAFLALASAAYFTGLMDLVYDLSFGDAGVAKGLDQRKTLFGLGLEQFGRNPLIGTGLRGFADVDGNFWDRPVHNLFGQAAVELGVLGALILALIFFILSLDLTRILGSGSPIARLAAVELMMLLAAFQIGQSEPNLDQSNLWIVLALAQATILVHRNSAGSKGSEPSAP